MSGHGMAGHVGLGKQTTWGTPVGATDYLTVMSENLTETRDRFEKENIYGGLYEPNDVAGVRRVGGDITFSAHPETLGDFLNAVLGTTVVTSINAALAVASFKPRTTDVSSVHPNALYSFEIARDVGSSQQYSDCMVTGLSLELAPNQALKATASIIGRSSTNIASTTPSFSATPVDGFTADSASLSIGGTATDLIEGLTIGITNNFSGRPSLNNSNTIARVKRDGPVEIRVSGNIGFENITEYQLFMNQTAQALKLTMFEAGSFQLVVDIPSFVYTAFPLGMGGREYQLVGFEGRANYHVSSATAIEALLTTVKSDW